MAARSGHDRNSDLTTLDTGLRRVARRADRQRRGMQQTPEAWQRWSATIDEGDALAARIETAPVDDLAGLAVKFRAVLWRIRTDEGIIMDEVLGRALQWFGRDVARLLRQ